MKFGVGQPVRRLEDDRFVTGKGCYTDDLSFAGQAHGVMVRSPHAHARIVGIDITDARAAPGVLAIYTGEDLERAGVGEMPCMVELDSLNGEMFRTRRPVLARERARYVGDPVAMVVAETEAQARDAADLTAVEYEPLPVVTDLEAAASGDAPVIWEEAGSNIAFDWSRGDEDQCKAAFARAGRIVSFDRLINNRIVVNAMEPRAAIGFYDGDRDAFTLYVGSQGVFSVRLVVAGVLGVPQESVRVVTHDVGGGFGMKLFAFAEYPLVLFAARDLKRPVRWTADRVESFLSDSQGRGHVTRAAMALDKDARILAVWVDTLADLGAYESQFGPMIPTRAPAGMQIGVYDVPVLYNRVRGVLTNTTPVDAYRGAGRPEASYVIERLMSKAARELDLSPEEIRRRNFQTKRKPADGEKNTATLPMDNPDLPGTLAMGLEMVEADGFEARREDARRRGKRAGMGMAYYVERTASGIPEFARIAVHGDGHVDVYAGTQSTGQGHETAWAQMVGERFGVPVDQVRLQPGDTDSLAGGGGTGGSRSVYTAAGALGKAADDLIEKGCRLAANELEAAHGDIEYRGSQGEAAFAVVGTDRTLGLYEVAALASRQADAGDALEGSGKDLAASGTYPNGCHVCEVEIDEETGALDITRYVAADDFGNLVNPMLVAGQVHGGIVQGLGQAMGEQAVFDTVSGQPLAGSLMDYPLPRADDFPDFAVRYNKSASSSNPLGVKGCGEAGTVGAPAAFVNAVLDALADLGVETVDMPLTPARLWRIMQEASSQ